MPSFDGPNRVSSGLPANLSRPAPAGVAAGQTLATSPFRLPEPLRLRLMGFAMDFMTSINLPLALWAIKIYSRVCSSSKMNAVHIKPYLEHPTLEIRIVAAEIYGKFCNRALALKILDDTLDYLPHPGEHILPRMLKVASAYISLGEKEKAFQIIERTFSGLLNLAIGKEKLDDWKKLPDILMKPKVREDFKFYYENVHVFCQLMVETIRTIGELGNDTGIILLNSLLNALDDNNNPIHKFLRRDLKGIDYVQRLNDLYFTISKDLKRLGKNYMALDILNELIAQPQSSIQASDLAVEICKSADQTFINKVVKLMELCTQDKSAIVRLGGYKGLGRLGYAEKALEGMKQEDFLDSLFTVYRDIKAEIIRAIGDIGDPRGIELLRPFLTDPTPAIRITAAEAIGKLGELYAAQNIVSDTACFPKMDSKVAHLFANIGNPKAIEFLLDLNMGFEDMAPAIYDFLENYKPESPTLSQQTHITKKAERIRAACRELYYPAGAELAKGYGNRGIRPGRRTAFAGSDFQNLKLVPMNQTDPKNIDWNATARLGETERAMGMVVVKEYRTEEANKVMIVIDPKVFEDNDSPEKISSLAGTIAQVALQRRDMVGLIIGTRKIYIKPSQDKAQLEKIIARILAFQKDGNEDGVLQILDQDYLRANLPQGAQIFFISNFENENLEHVQRTIKLFSNLGVEFTPVATDVFVPVPHPIIEIGRFRFKLHEKKAQVIADAIALQQAEAMNKLLDERTGIMINLSVKDDVIQQTIAEIKAKDQCHPKHNKIQPRGRLVGEKVYNITSPEPDDFLPRFEAATVERKSNILASVWQAACLRGWSSPLEYLHKKIQEIKEMADKLPEEYRHNKPSFDYEKEFNDTYRPDKATGPITDFLNDPALHKSLQNGIRKITERPIDMIEAFSHLLAWYPDIDFVRLVLAKHEELESLLEEKKEIKPSLRELINASMMGNSLKTSVANKDETEEEKRVWMNLGTIPRERNRYLRTVTRIVFDPAHSVYQEHPQITAGALGESGKGNIIGRLEFKIKKEMQIPQLVGGKIEIVERKKIVYSTSESTPETIDRVLSLPLSEFRAKASGIYGKELYELSTVAPGIEEITKLNPGIAKEWEELLAEIEHLPVKDAIARIQEYIVNHPTLNYHRYASDVAKTLFGSLKERADKGECKENEYLALILKLGGGTCREMATLGLTLLRLAGIPTSLSSGWMAEWDGKVRQMGHSWAEVMIPYEGEKWHGLPVEFSRVNVSKETSHKIEKMKEEREQKAAEEIAREVTEAMMLQNLKSPVETYWEKIDGFWEQASLEQKQQLMYALDSLASIIHFRDQNWPGTSANIAGLILLSLEKQLGGGSPLTPMHISGSDFKPSEYLSRIFSLRHAGYRNLQDFENTRVLIERWFGIMRKTIPSMPFSLFEEKQ